MKLDVLDMFCGAGGSSSGARSAGARVRAGIDGWDLAVHTFQDNFQDAEVHHRMLTPGCAPGGEFREGAFDMIIASPECTNHSPAKGSAPRCENSKATSHYVINFAARLRPRWIVLENVVQLKLWNGFDTLLEELRRQKYRIRFENLDASEFGVPQTRRRLFVLCDRERDVPAIPRSRKLAPPASSILRLDGKYDSRPLYSDRRAAATIERAERAISALGKKVPFLIVYYGSDGAGGGRASIGRCEHSRRLTDSDLSLGTARSPCCGCSRWTSSKPQWASRKATPWSVVPAVTRSR